MRRKMLLVSPQVEPDGNDSHSFIRNSAPRIWTCHLPKKSNSVMGRKHEEERICQNRR
jgi:hypothetical protein